MNPLLYKAPPLLLDWIEILTHPTAHALDDVSKLALTFLAVNTVFALGLSYAARRVTGSALPFMRSCLLVLPSCLLYMAPMLTVVSAVVARDFHWEDRFIPVFAIFVASQMLGVFYTVALRYWSGLRALDVATGMAVSMLLLLVSIPVCLALLSLHAIGALALTP